MKSITSIKSLQNKIVLLRADFNVPIENGKVRDAFRIEKTLPTIDYLVKKGARIIIVSHAGEDGSVSLQPVATWLSKKMKVRFITDPLPNAIEFNTTKIVLLENIRQNSGEMNNDRTFAKKLARLADVYVNDAFSVSHRKHASLVLIPKLLPSYAGLQVMEEVKHLSLILKPKHPFLFILGGAKFDTKMPLIDKFIQSADHMLITGALMNNFFKDAGFEIGKSLYEPKDFHLQKLLKTPKLLLPVDVVVTQKDGGKQTKSIAEITSKDIIVDIGSRTVQEVALLIAKAKLVVWNGPTGLYEKGFDRGTRGVLELLVKSKATTIIGGGDTVALVHKLHLEKKFTFVSTGGGATLAFLTKGTLPGLKALE
ncbi:phosphoglycerate kinase [Candidatus Nomurabacteria bacterium]|nr:MAG: phosphoglycerate kinase [Candidatus Nomurabacteria bacterium]